MPTRKTTTKKAAQKSSAAHKGARGKGASTKAAQSSDDAGEVALVVPGANELAGYFSPEEVSAEAALLAGGQDGWPFLSPRNGRFRFDGQELGTTLNVVILRYTLENYYNTKPFDPSSPGAPPDCQAILPVDGGTLAPPEWFGDPQHEKCGGCPMNQFGSKVGDGGVKRSGKACSNYTRIALVPSDALDGSIPTFALARISPTSRKAFAIYTKGLERLGLALRGVETQITLGPGIGNSPFQWLFQPRRTLTKAEMPKVEEWYEASADELERYQLSVEG